MGKLVTKDRVKIAVSSMPGDWDTASDPSVKRTNTKMRREAGGTPEVVSSRQELESITLTRVWDPDRDSAIWDEIKRGNLYPDSTISLQTIDENGVPQGKPDVYAGCVVEEASKTGADANSGEDVVKLTVVFTAPRSA